MRIATRGSALALAQAEWVAARLPGPVELVKVTTSGDRRRAVDDKREWVLEIEEALLRGDADLAVHSAKDVPVALAVPWPCAAGERCADAVHGDVLSFRSSSVGPVRAAPGRPGQGREDPRAESADPPGDQMASAFSTIAVAPP